MLKHFAYWTSGLSMGCALACFDRGDLKAAAICAAVAIIQGWSANQIAK
jgi:hypothetical protein